MANPKSAWSVTKSIIAFFFILAVLFALVLGILYFVGYDVNSLILEPADRKISGILCGKQPLATKWTECEDFSQTRTNYECNFQSVYGWKNITQTQACVPPHQEEEYLLQMTSTFLIFQDFQKKKYLVLFG